MKKILSIAIFTLLAVNYANAARVEMMKDVPERGDFDLGPTSFEIEASPGEKITKTMQITNRKGVAQNFLVAVEDFQGSMDDPEKTVLLQGDKDGKYGAKDWVVPEMTTFQLKHGERQFFDVTIEVPKNADAGDHYASVLVSAPPTVDAENTEDRSKPNVMITSRVGALFFVKVKGNIREEGMLRSFAVKEEINKQAPVDFKIIFENKGTVRIQPSGRIEIKNIAGNVVDVVAVNSFNVLRDSFRAVNFQWNPGDFSFGQYTAQLQLARGYGDLTDSKSVTFWVIPVKKIMIGIGIFAIMFLLIHFFRKNIKISTVKKK